VSLDHERDPLGREVARALPRSGHILHEYDPLCRIRRRWATSSGALRRVRSDDEAMVTMNRRRWAHESPP
jgi:hypothetical protein